LSFGPASEAPIMHWSALFSWLVAACCIALGWRKLRRLAELSPPDAPSLLSDLAGKNTTADELDDVARRLAIAELNQRLADISFELEVLPATYAALVRITLASGSALALLSFLTATSEAPLIRTARLAAAALGGLVGAGTVAAVGRSAKMRSRQIREKWDGSSREIGKALGTSLASSGGIRGNSFPE